MTMPVTASAPPSAAANAAKPTAQQAGGFNALGQGDFLRLMTVQMQQQDPFDPVDNKEMLAQMAQFSQLSGITGMQATLEQIAGKLDAIAASNAAALTLSAQNAASANSPSSDAAQASSALPVSA